ncbi:hypothetical protein BD414DRAFT_497983 [Trametes punicea]|nr:hypothetical protein BD414DRAFT_497983 [Trametes punicea]
MPFFPIAGKDGEEQSFQDLLASQTEATKRFGRQPRKLPCTALHPPQRSLRFSSRIRECRRLARKQGH